jgi:hypothetical protein
VVSVDVVSVENLPVLLTRLDPVSVENAVGCEVVVPFMVDAVNVDTTIVLLTRLDPVSVENVVGCTVIAP